MKALHDLGTDSGRPKSKVTIVECGVVWLDIKDDKLSYCRCVL